MHAFTSCSGIKTQLGKKILFVHVHKCISKTAITIFTACILTAALVNM